MSFLFLKMMIIITMILIDKQFMILTKGKKSLSLFSHTENLFAFSRRSLSSSHISRCSLLSSHVSRSLHLPLQVSLATLEPIAASLSLAPFAFLAASLSRLNLLLALVNLLYYFFLYFSFISCCFSWIPFSIENIFPIYFSIKIFSIYLFSWIFWVMFLVTFWMKRKKMKHLFIHTASSLDLTQISNLVPWWLLTEF